MNRYDSNRNGYLGFTEVKVFMIDIGYPNLSNNDVHWFISLLDTNRDSKIAWSELYNSLK